MIFETPPDDWRDLEARVAEIWTNCGFQVAIGQELQTARGVVNIDVRAEIQSHGRKLLHFAECKFWKTPVPKSVVHAFRTVVQDAGAHVGHLISNQGFQSGAIDAAVNSNLVLQDWDGFQAEWLETWKAARYERSSALFNNLFDYMDYFHPRTTDVLHAIPERVAELQHLWKRYAQIASANSYAASLGIVGFPPSLPYTIAFEEVDGSITTTTFKDYSSLFSYFEAKAVEGIAAFETFISRYSK